MIIYKSCIYKTPLKVKTNYVMWITIINHKHEMNSYLLIIINKDATH